MSLKHEVLPTSAPPVLRSKPKCPGEPKVVQDPSRSLLKVLPLERIIVSKTAANREKDRKVMPLLKAALIAWKAMMKR